MEIMKMNGKSRFAVDTAKMEERKGNAELIKKEEHLTFSGAKAFDRDTRALRAFSKALEGNPNSTLHYVIEMTVAMLKLRRGDNYATRHGVENALKRMGVLIDTRKE